MREPESAVRGTGYGAATQKAAKQEMAYSDFLEGLLREEAAGRNVRKQSTMTRLAGFPVVKTLDDFNYDFAKGVKRSQIEEFTGLGVSWNEMKTWYW